LDFDTIFTDPRLHLLAWDRQDPAAHAAGLQFAARLQHDPRLATLAMPLLRPFGRGGRDVLAILKPAAEVAGTPLFWSCELWLQVAAPAEPDLWSLLQGTVASRPSGMVAVRSPHGRRHERWQPFGGSVSSPYVVGSGPAHGSSEEAVYDSLPAEARATVLKGIWGRGTRELLQAFAPHGSTHMIDVHTQRDELARVLARVLASFDLRELGSAMPSHHTDPSRFGVAHLSCFAANAFTTMHLEQAYGDNRATRPHCFPTLADYLAGIRKGVW
jgi:hypothetical protein